MSMRCMRTIAGDPSRSVAGAFLGVLIAAVCAATEPAPADVAAAPSMTGTATSADAAPSQSAEAPFKATLLLITNDWTKVAKAAEIEAQMRQALKDVPVPKAYLDQLPASGPHVLFSEGVASFYDPAHYRELIAWLKANDLIAGKVDFPPPTVATPPESLPLGPQEQPPASHFSASLNVGYEALGVDSSSEVRPQPFIERTMNYRWTIQQKDEVFTIDRIGFVLEKSLGETTARETLRRSDPSCVFSFVKERVAVVDAISAASSSILRTYRQERNVALIAIEPAHTQIPDGPGIAQLHLPEKVEQVRTVPSAYDRARSRGTTRSRALATTSSQGDEVIRLFELEHVRAESLMATLQQLYPDKLLIGVPSGRNQLIVRGTAPQLDEVSALLERLDQPAESDEKVASVPPTPKPPIGRRSQDEFKSFVSPAPGSKAVWQQQYTALEQAAAELAQKCRELATKADSSPQDAQQLQALRNQLRTVVTEAFAARQQLHRTELWELQQRMARVEQTLELRDRIQDQIIDRRVEDLLDPSLQWEAEPADQPSGAIRVPGPPSSRPAASRLPAEVPQAAPPSPATQLREIPADTSGILRRATEFQTEFRKAQKSIDSYLQRLQELSPTASERPVVEGSLAKYLQQDLAPLRDEFDAQVRLLELNVSDAKQSLDAAVGKRDLTKKAYERGILPVSELADVERAVGAAQYALEHAQTILDLYRKIQPPSGQEEPKPADQSSPTQAKTGR